MLFQTNFKEFIITVVILLMDIAVLVSLFIAATKCTKKYSQGGVVTSSLSSTTEESYDAMKEICKQIGKPLPSFSSVKMYILCIVTGVCYIIAALLNIAKIFYDFPFLKSAKWFICFLFSLIFYVMALVGMICTWNVWRSYYRCAEKYMSESPSMKELWETMKDTEPYPTMIGFTPYFVIVLLVGFAGFSLEACVSFNIRKSESD